jgi:hypothetical protein
MPPNLHCKQLHIDYTLFCLSDLPSCMLMKYLLIHNYALMLEPNFPMPSMSNTVYTVVHLANLFLYMSLHNYRYPRYYDYSILFVIDRNQSCNSL